MLHVAQARDMTAVDLLLDVLRMCSIDEAGLTRRARTSLEAAIATFRKVLRLDETGPDGLTSAGGSTASSAKLTGDDPSSFVGAQTNSDDDCRMAAALAGWRADSGLGTWTGIRVSQLVAAGRAVARRKEESQSQTRDADVVADARFLDATPLSVGMGDASDFALVRCATPCALPTAQRPRHIT